MALGPVQVIAIGFDRLDRLQGQILYAIDELTPLGAARIVDALFVAKEDDGALVALEIEDVGLGDVDEDLGQLVGQLLGFSFEGEAEGGQGDGSDTSLLGVSAADIERIGTDLAPGTGALLLLVEHRWATGLRDAIIDAGGRVLVQGFLTQEALLMIGAELAATADAIDAVEAAIELEAEAHVRALSALATIEIADEIRAAVVADTILALVEAGFIERSVADQAAAALVDPALVARANSAAGEGT